MTGPASTAQYSTSPSCPAPENEDNILKHVCEQIAMSDGSPHIASSTGTHPRVAIIEYQNPLNAAGILGELLAQYRHQNRVIQINHIGFSADAQLTLPIRRQLELHGLDQDEIAFLSAKNAFSLPSREVWYVALFPQNVAR